MEKGGEGFCTYGLEKGNIILLISADDNTFTNWNASIYAPNVMLIE